MGRLALIVIDLALDVLLMHLAVYLTFAANRTPRQPHQELQLSDYMSGVYAALGVLVALQSREKTGSGQIVDVAYTKVFSEFLTS